MHPAILAYADLQDMCRPGEKPRLATVVAWADNQGIRYRYDGKGGIWTTIDAVNIALGVTAANDDAQPYRADDVI